MDNLALVRSFVAVVERNSFTRAAAHLGLSKGRVSAQIRELEAELGVALFTRTTRAVVVTDAGRRFFEQGVQLLQMADAAVRAARTEHDSLEGTLRVTAAVEYAEHILASAVAAFSALHPRLHIELILSSRVAHLVAEHIDVAIRISDKLKDSGDRSVRLARFRLVAVASPRYLAGRRRPQSPAELHQLDWIVHTGFESLAWSTGSGSRKVTSVKLPGRLKVDSVAAQLALVLDDRGAAVLPEWTVTGARAAGHVVELLPDYRLPDHSVFAVHPDLKPVPAKVRMFVDFLKTRARC